MTKSQGLAETLTLNVCDAPKAQAWSGWAWWPWLSLRDIADPRHQGSAPSVASKLAEQSENVYENKG
jgi:hypothetical protein